MLVPAIMMAKLAVMLLDAAMMGHAVSAEALLLFIPTIASMLVFSWLVNHE